MAKTSGGGGGLFGRADSTLVAAAFKEGQSRVGADLGDVYKKREESLKTLGTGIQTAFDNIFAEQEAEEEKTNESIQKFNPDKQFEAMMNSHIDAVEWQKGELARIDKEYKKGSTEYRKAMAKFNSNKEEYSKKLLKWQDIFDDIKDKGSNNAIFGYEAGSPMQKLLGSIFQDANENTDLTKPTYDPALNDLVYTLPGSDKEMIPNPKYVDANQTPNEPEEIENPHYAEGGVKMTLSELYENLETRDNTAPLAVSTAITNIIKYGKTSDVPKKTRIEDFHSDLINNIMVNHQDIINVGKDAGLPGMNGNSVEQYLTQPDKLDKGVNNPVLAEIYDILKTMDVDFNNDTKINADDKTFINTDNAAKLAENIMKDDSVYKKVIAKVISEQAGNNAFDRGEADKEKDKKDKGDGSSGVKYFKANQNFAGISGGQLNTLIDKLDSGTVSVDGVSYNRDPSNNSWAPVGGGDAITGNDMLMKLKEIHAGTDGYNFPTDQRFTRFQGTSLETKELVTSEDKVEKTPGTFSKFMSAIDMNTMDLDDDDIASAIQEFMPAMNTTANPNNYQFSSYRTSGQITGGESFSETISLYDGDGYIVRYPAGHSKAGKKIKIKTGGDTARRKQALKDLDDVLTIFGLGKGVKTGSGGASQFNITETEKGE